MKKGRKENNIEDITKEIINFRNKRNWKQFHNSKDLALGLMIEAGELNELFLWKKAEDVNVEKLKEELADVLIFSFLLAHNHNLDIIKIIKNKLKINSKKYPVKSAKNSSKKYDEI